MGDKATGKKQDTFRKDLIKMCKKEPPKIKKKNVKVDLEKEIGNLRRAFDVPEERFDMKIVKPIFGEDSKATFKCGSLHTNSPDFLILSRGRQGPAVSVAAIATSHLIPAKCWNRQIIDQVVIDGDTYYTVSYRSSKIHNRNEFQLTDLLGQLRLQNTKLVTVKFCEADFAGNFQSEDPRSMSLAEALERYFKVKNDCILMSPVLNVAIWRSEGKFCMFDGQPRDPSGQVSNESEGPITAKLFILPDLKTVLYVILKQSGVQNEPFVVRKVSVKNIEEFQSGLTCTDEVKVEVSLDGYQVVNDFRAVVRGSYHLETSSILESLRNKSHLILATACLIYSKVVESNRWTTPLLNMIFDKSNIFLMDFVISLGKRFDEPFEVRISDLVADFILGLYSAKIKVIDNVVPGSGKKAKMTLEEGIRHFFEDNNMGIIELKKIFYAIWKFNSKYYFFDPFACDKRGFRLDPKNPEDEHDLRTATSVVFMTSSVRELSKVLVQNTGVGDKDAFVIHSLTVLYIKTNTPEDSQSEDVLFRAENTSRRPEPDTGLPLRGEEEFDENEKGEVIKKLLEITHITEGVQNMAKNHPDLMKDVEVVILTEETEKNIIFTTRFGDDFDVLNPDTVFLEGSHNCQDERYPENRRGLQGVLTPLVTIIQSRKKAIVDWTRTDVDEILQLGDKTYENLLKEEKGSDDESEESSEEEEEEPEEESEEEELPLFDMSMLPEEIKMRNQVVSFTAEEEVGSLDVTDSEEFQSGLEEIFEEYGELILECSEKFYGVWKVEEMFCFFNPYGSEEGPATVLVTEALTELMKAIESIANEEEVVVHAVEITSITDSDKKCPNTIKLPNDEPLFGNKFFDKDVIGEKGQKISDLKEKLQSPDAFTLFLISSNRDQNTNNKKTVEEEAYEKLKFEKPYLFPERRILCTLMEAKQASKSVQSLLSRFSIDSRLPMKKGTSDNVINKGEVDKLKLIKIPPNIYFYSQTLTDDTLPIRSIKGFFVKKNVSKMGDEHLRKLEPFEDVAIGEVKPVVVPLGPIIRTPVSQNRCKDDATKAKKKFNVLEEKYDVVFKLLFEENQDTEEQKKIKPVVLPEVTEMNGSTDETTNEKDTKNEEAENKDVEDEESENAVTKEDLSTNEEMKDKETKDKEGLDQNLKAVASEIKRKIVSYDKFQPTYNEDVQIINGSTCFIDRMTPEINYYKPCFFASIIIILIKSLVNVNEELSHCLLDYCIIHANKYYHQCGKIKYKDFRRIFNLEVLGSKFNIIVEEACYGYPDYFQNQNLSKDLESFMVCNKSGIIVFTNIAYAFWFADGYYLFDSYGCDKDGGANESGECALTLHKTKRSLIDMVIRNTGETFDKFYIIYKLRICHMSPKGNKQICKKVCPEPEVEEARPKTDSDSEESSSESLDGMPYSSIGYLSLPNHEAEILDASLMEDIELPLVPTVQLLQEQKAKLQDALPDVDEDINVPLDLCIMAWSQINDPAKWDTETLKSLYEASKRNATYNASSFKNYPKNADNVEFNVENICFRAAFAPLFHGTCERTDDGKLSKCLKRTFETKNYSGAIVCLGDSHVGVMKNDAKFYAWWAVKGTKNVRQVKSKMLDEVINLAFQDVECNSQSVQFTVKPVLVSYASKDNFDWITEMQECHYDPASLFRQTVAKKSAIFILGTSVMKGRNALKEPHMKRCYFAAILTVLLRRDVVFCLAPGIVDKIVDIAEFLYKKIPDAVHHSDLILHKIPVFNRIFDFRDRAFPLVKLENRHNVFSVTKNHIKKFLDKYSSGIIQFTNCCFGFWYSKLKRNYYYLDPYACNKCGKKVSKKGKASLGIFPTLSKMVRNMVSKLSCDTTGFFIHHLHVNSVNVPLIKDTPEDPIWTYLDYHWKYDSGENPCRKKTTFTTKRPKWNFYTIEIADSVMSLWSSIGTYDSKFLHTAGKNRAAICVAVLALRNLVNEDRWSSKFLDYCVLQGHKYYVLSQKKAWKNRLALQPCWTIAPYFTWDFEFGPGIVGKLYDTVGNRSLRQALDNWLTPTKEIQLAILECGEVTLGLLKNRDIFYIINPCLTGQPVFPKNRGATFVLRCQNFSAMLYCLVRSINSCHEFPFCITTLSSCFYRSTDYDGISCLGIKNLLISKQKSLGTVSCRYVKQKFKPVAILNSDSLTCFETRLSLGLMDLARQKEPKPETCEMGKEEIPKQIHRVRYGFPRLIDFLEGLVTNERIPERQKLLGLEASIESYTPITREEVKAFTENWKKDLYLKYHSKDENESGESENESPESENENP